MLTREQTWKLGGLGEEELDIKYADSPSLRVVSGGINLSHKSEEQPFVTKMSKVKPCEQHFSIGGETTKINYDEKNVARESIARKMKESLFLEHNTG